ncbi:MAG: hypothetical protein ACP5OE_08835 [Thermodesulfobium sp.]
MNIVVLRKIIRSLNLNNDEEIIGVEGYHSQYYERDFIALRIADCYGEEYLFLFNPFTGEWEGWVHFSDEGDPIENIDDRIKRSFYNKIREQEGLTPL